MHCEYTSAKPQIMMCCTAEKWPGKYQVAGRQSQRHILLQRIQQDSTEGERHTHRKQLYCSEADLSSEHHHLTVHGPKRTEH